MQAHADTRETLDRGAHVHRVAPEAIQLGHDENIAAFLRVTEATSRFPERDTLILLLGITCGMRVTEIARLEVHHVLSKSGIRKE